MGSVTTKLRRGILMPGVYRLPEDERKARDERKKRKAKEWYEKNKEKQSEYYKVYNQDESNKESHRLAQQKYRRTAKGRACDERYWKKRSSRTRKEDKDPTISV